MHFTLEIYPIYPRPVCISGKSEEKHLPHFPSRPFIGMAELFWNAISILVLITRAVGLHFDCLNVKTNMIKANKTNENSRSTECCSESYILLAGVTSSSV